MKLVQIYFKKPNKVAVISNFLAFFQFLVDKFTLLDPDPDPLIECGSRSRRENECGSGSTALPDIRLSSFSWVRSLVYLIFSG